MRAAFVCTGRKEKYQLTLTLETAVKLKSREARLDAFCKETGRTKLLERGNIVGYNKSVSGKVAWAAKKANSESSVSMITNAVGKPVTTVNHSSVTGKPNTITQRTGSKGGIDRNYYGDDGRQTKQISNHDHGHKAESHFGKNGEHAHDYEWNDGELIGRGSARELTGEERRENADIL